jgi:hypothetical protein
MTDIASIKERLAKCVRLFGAGEKANARRVAERALESICASWTDLGDWIEHSYSEAEMLEMVAVVRKEEQARAPQHSGCIVLPEPLEMAEFCRQQPHRLKDHAQREFIDEMYSKTKLGLSLQLGTLGYLVSIYIKLGGRIR